MWTTTAAATARTRRRTAAVEATDVRMDSNDSKIKDWNVFQYNPNCLSLMSLCFMCCDSRIFQSCPVMFATLRKSLQCTTKSEVSTNSKDSRNEWSKKSSGLRCSPTTSWIFQNGLLSRCLFADIHMGVSKNRGTPKWMVYNGKSY